MTNPFGASLVCHFRLILHINKEALDLFCCLESPKKSSEESGVTLCDIGPTKPGSLIIESKKVELRGCLDLG